MISILSPCRGGGSNYENKYLELIENNLREIFIYYFHLKNKHEKNISKKIKKYCKKHFLRFRYEEYTLEKINRSVQNLSFKLQNILYMRHGKDLLSYNELNDNLSVLYLAYRKLKEELEKKPVIIHPKSLRGIYSSLSFEQLNAYVEKLPSQYQKVIYLRHGKNLDKYNKFQENKSYGAYYAMYQKAIKALEQVMLGIILRENKKGVIDKYSKEDLLYALPKISKNIQKSIYLRHGKDLDRTISWTEIENFDDKPLSFYRNNYYQSYAFIDRVLIAKKELQEASKKTSIKKLEESFVFSDSVYNEIKTSVIVNEVSDEAKKKTKRGFKSNSKNILTEVTREDLLWTITYLNKHQLEILYTRHGNNLDMVLEWPEIPKGKKENYYFYSYYNICKRIHSLLENRTNQLTKSKLQSNLKDTTSISIESQEKIKSKVKDTEPQTISKKQKIKLEEDQSQSISKKRALLIDHQKVMENQKAINLKIELYNRFYALYGEVFSSEELENIICEVIYSYVQDEGININYFCQFKIEAIILNFLANKYKIDPDSDESLNILMHINNIFVKKMKTKYPFMQDSRIEIAIEEVLHNYEVEKNFSVELMKKLRQMK